jgi:hypothetical protein
MGGSRVSYQAGRGPSKRQHQHDNAHLAWARKFCGFERTEVHPSTLGPTLSAHGTGLVAGRCINTIMVRFVIIGRVFCFIVERTRIVQMEMVYRRIRNL